MQLHCCHVRRVLVPVLHLPSPVSPRPSTVQTSTVTTTTIPHSVTGTSLPISCGSWITVSLGVEANTSGHVCHAVSHCVVKLACMLPTLCKYHSVVPCRCLVQQPQCASDTRSALGLVRLCATQRRGVYCFAGRALTPAALLASGAALHQSHLPCVPGWWARREGDAELWADDKQAFIAKPISPVSSARSASPCSALSYSCIQVSP